MKRGFTVTDYDKYMDIIKARLSEQRFAHSVNVSRSAAALARKYGADESKARLSGILHDITKEMPLDEQYRYIIEGGGTLSKLELNSRFVIHQRSGEAYCRLVLGITDKDVLDAIRYHTTGRRNMPLLERVVYTADLISADRNYPDVEVMRRLASESLEEAMLHSLKYTINLRVGEGSLLHPDTLDCYNYLIEESIKD